MPDQKTILRRSYLVICFAVFVLTLSLLVIFKSPSREEDRLQEMLYTVSSDMLYYPEETLDIYLDERLVDKVASEPVVKTDKDRIDEYVSYICGCYPNVTNSLIQSVIMSESSYNPLASNGNHVGLMQVSTYYHKDRAERLGVSDLRDPYGNILVGTDYLSELIESVNGDIAWALMIYNMGYKSAYNLHSKGIISSYASNILSRL